MVDTLFSLFGNPNLMGCHCIKLFMPPWHCAVTVQPAAYYALADQQNDTSCSYETSRGFIRKTIFPQCHLVVVQPHCMLSDAARCCSILRYWCRGGLRRQQTCDGPLITVLLSARLTGGCFCANIQFLTAVNQNNVYYSIDILSLPQHPVCHLLIFNLAFYEEGNKINPLIDNAMVYLPCRLCTSLPSDRSDHGILPTIC